MATSTILWIVGGIILIIVVVGAVISFNSEKSLVEERIDNYLEEGDGLEFSSGAEGDEEGEKESFITRALNARLEKSSFGDKVQIDLAQADIKLKSGEFVALMVIAGFAASILAYVFGQGGDVAIIFALVGFVVGLFLPRFVVRSMKGRRLTRFADQLPGMLNLMVNGLRAGFSTLQAMEAVAKEMPSPVNEEFRRVVLEMQLGIPMDKALDNLLVRIPSEDLDLVITAINVQREVGGNLSEILETISHTIRERIRIKGEIKTLTAQAIYSGRMLSLLPIFILFILYGLNKEYMMEFFNKPLCGYPALICSGIMIVIAYIVMGKIGEVEV